MIVEVVVGEEEADAVGGDDKIQHQKEKYYSNLSNTNWVCYKMYHSL